MYRKQALDHSQRPKNPRFFLFLDHPTQDDENLVEPNPSGFATRHRKSASRLSHPPFSNELKKRISVVPGPLLIAAAFHTLTPETMARPLLVHVATSPSDATLISVPRQQESSHQPSAIS